MRRIARLLPDEYYLDKNFFPLADKITEEIIKDGYYGNLPEETIREIVLDVLTCIKPQEKEIAKG
jgi:hypothetical protein